MRVRVKVLMSQQKGTNREWFLYKGVVRHNSPSYHWGGGGGPRELSSTYHWHHEVFWPAYPSVCSKVLGTRLAKVLFGFNSQANLGQWHHKGFPKNTFAVGSGRASDRCMARFEKPSKVS